MDSKVIDYTADQGGVEVVSFDAASSTVQVAVITSIVNTGQAVVPGGKTGQVYTKKSDADYDAEWQDNLAYGVEAIKGAAESSYSQGYYEITPGKIGLGNVDNTSDADKPVSKAQAEAHDALNAKINKNTSAITNLSETLTAHTTNVANPHNVTKAQLGLSNVDNTADIDKPISTAQAAAIQALQTNLNTQVNDIKSVIPSQASADNKLADKDFVNSSIQNMAAFYITKNVNRDPFDTRAELVAGPYYFQGKLQTPSINDYAIVLKDESKTPDASGQYPTTRYMYDGTQWGFQYIVNNTTLTAAQLAAINSGATEEIINKAKNATHFQDVASFSIDVDDWVEDNTISPFKFKATKSITSGVVVSDDAAMSISFDNVINSVGVVVASVVGTSVFTAVFYAVNKPSATITGTLGGAV